MSLPRDILDQLLSGYIDDALSDDERARIEQLLRDDSDVARELQDLLDLRGSLRELRREDQELTLGANFADRVLKATVDQATAEGLSDEHPVMRLTEQPSTSVAHKGFPVLKIAGAVAALAASIVLAIVMLRPPNDKPEEGLIVQHDPAVSGKVNEQEVPVVPGPDEEMVQDSLVQERNNKVRSPGEVPDSVEVPEQTGTSTDNIAQVHSSGTPDQLNPDLRLQPFIMVVEVRQTEAGRENDAVSKAMTRAKLELKDQKRIDRKLTGFGKQLANQEDDVKVLYVEDLATKLDNFINAMIADFDGIESVGFSFSADAPILKLANTLERVADPKKVRHGANWELVDDGSRTLQELASELGDRNFRTIKRGEAAAAIFGKKRKDGKDVRTRIFVLMR